MTARLGRLYPVITIAATLVVFGGGASAQGQLEARLAAAVQKIEAACSDDLKKYCSTVTPGEGRSILCIEAHEDKISTKCDYALFEAARNLDRALDRIEQVADICWNDIEKHCSNLPEGAGRIAQCLATRQASLTPACQAEIGKFQPGK